MDAFLFSYEFQNKMSIMPIDGEYAMPEFSDRQMMGNLFDKFHSLNLDQIDISNFKFRDNVLYNRIECTSSSRDQFSFWHPQYEVRQRDADSPVRYGSYYCYSDKVCDLMTDALAGILRKYETNSIHSDDDALLVPDASCVPYLDESSLMWVNELFTQKLIPIFTKHGKEHWINGEFE